MKFEIGTEVIINDTALIERDDDITFVPDMMYQLGKRGTIIKREKRRTNYIYQIKTEDEDDWWYMPKWFRQLPLTEVSGLQTLI